MALTVGTAGHIDHGKTALVRALTGTDCDRLEEEKRRGITIELGFASLDLPGGGQVSFVDVPGHERFVRTMAAGAFGVDLVLLVISAGEGVMPQTREHLDICRLLGMERGAVVLGKADLVDADMLELVREEVRELTQGTFLENAPVFAASALTGQGIDEIRAFLTKEFSRPRHVRCADLTRLPIDRAFTLHGHGTVIGGTLISGEIASGDTLRLYPGETTARVRELQSHGKSSKKAAPGRRAAVNLAGLSLEDVRKGDVAAHPGTLSPSVRFTARVSCLPGSPRPLRHRMELHFHLGAREHQARLHLLEGPELAPGQSGLAHIILSEPDTAVFGDPFVLRSFSPLQTVGGGVILHPKGLLLSKRDPAYAERLALLRSLPEDEPKTRVLHVLQLEARPANPPLGVLTLRLLTGLARQELEAALAALVKENRAARVEGESPAFTTSDRMAGLEAGCLAFVAEFHRRFSEKPGPRRGEITVGKEVPASLLAAAVERLILQKKLCSTGDALHLPEHRPVLTGRTAELGEAVAKAHEDAGLAPPHLPELLEQLGIPSAQAGPMMAGLQNSGRLIKVAENIWYSPAPLKDVENRIREWFTSRDNLDLADLKAMTGLSRKYLVALLEYFDAVKLTMRHGSGRKLR